MRYVPFSLFPTQPHARREFFCAAAPPAPPLIGKKDLTPWPLLI
jgi:hypothetical protein